MIEFALLFTCFRKLGPGFRKPSAGPVDVFRSLVMHRIFRNLDAGLVVLHDWNTATGNIEVFE